MDKVDKEILNNLSRNARMTLKELAGLCNLSTVAVHQRIKKLEEHSIIQGYHTQLDYTAMGYSTMVYIGVFLERAGLYKEVIKKLKKIPEVLECNFTTGNYSLFIKIICRDNRHLMEILSEKLQTIKGVARTETFVILENGIQRGLQI